MTLTTATPNDRSDAAVRRTVLCWFPAPGLRRISAAPRQNVDLLAWARLIERRGDNLFDQECRRLKYLTHLRSNRRSSRSEADAELHRRRRG